LWVTKKNCGRLNVHFERHSHGTATCCFNGNPQQISPCSQSPKSWSPLTHRRSIVTLALSRVHFLGVNIYYAENLSFFHFKRASNRPPSPPRKFNPEEIITTIWDSQFFRPCAVLSWNYINMGVDYSDIQISRQQKFYQDNSSTYNTRKLITESLHFVSLRWIMIRSRMHVGIKWIYGRNLGYVVQLGQTEVAVGARLIKVALDARHGQNRDTPILGDAMVNTCRPSARNE
jgi:hypothetical protein